jgi:hypothetical protein
MRGSKKSGSKQEKLKIQKTASSVQDFRSHTKKIEQLCYRFGLKSYLMSRQLFRIYRGSVMRAEQSFT